MAVTELKSEYIEGINNGKPYVIGDDEDHVPVPKGTTKRNWTYRKTLLNAVAHDPSHPIFNGIIMAAHHLISIEGMAKSGLGELIEDKGYDINWKENLIFLPYELEGACHLGVQLHRGNHTKKDVNQRNYHEMVEYELIKKKKDIRNCEPTPRETLNKLTKTLNRLSEKIVEMIEDHEVFLSSIPFSFEADNPRGCANAKTVSAHRKHPNTPEQNCRYNRDHQFTPNRKVMNAKNYPITYSKKHYSLKAGQ